ncbi:tripartite tricarboxylate transporter permease [Bradyrhizobium sp. LHD-71]|uniref:tripartite tricarboxylate transporter permease n=1 Tax=Bradyrhizobium sp. LHD-71 TaxID=3072141 RepID=UPI00280F4051|nr:tripartite tricarboxylate transporter permease [Bradyrhizobium sp. LHD-71]MDQ8729104.1 tripartite tricarboxylate transporter permease [Bradyrhizobium sp. LHD-71]
MEFNDLLLGFSIALTPTNLLLAFIGVFLGTVIGALPGIGPSAGVALLLPVTVGISPVTAMIMLAGIYYGAMYGGTITSVLINTPGESASVMTTLDGYQMALKGRAGAALGMAAIGSFIAGTVSVVLLMVAAPPLADVAVTFGPPEYFALMVLGLTALAGLTSGSILKALVMALVGLMLGTVGIDLMLGAPRFTFDNVNLLDGLDFLPVAVGLFAVGELLFNLYKPVRAEPIKAKLSGLLPTRQDWRDSRGGVARGTLVGFFVGVLPGAGATIASFLAYAIEKRISKHPEKFGTGAIEGVAAPESANNSASTGALIPLMALGIPGSGTTAVMLGALTLHGMQPGPLLMSTHPDVFWGLVASMYIGNVMLLILNLPLAPMFASILRVPYSVLIPFIIGIALIGVYSAENSLFNVGVAIVFGAIGFVMRLYGYPAAPLVLALVLGPMLEKALRQSLQMSLGSTEIFVTRPVSAFILALALLALLFPLMAAMRARRGKRVLAS